VGVSVDPSELGCRGGLVEDGLAVPHEVGVQEGGVGGLVESEAQRAVRVAQLDHLGASPAVPPPVENLPPLVLIGLAGG
jgi:hypothetical protein